MKGMTRCGYAGGCPNDALGLFRIAGVGDRGLCQVHVAVMERLGMDFRPLGAAPVPEWRRRSLARDFTGRVLA